MLAVALLRDKIKEMVFRINQCIINATSSSSQMFHRIDVLNNSAKFAGKTGEHLSQSILFDKNAGFQQWHAFYDLFRILEKNTEI